MLGERYGVLQAHPEGSRLIDQTASLEHAHWVARRDPSFEIYDYVMHEFVSTEVAADA